MRKRVLVLTMVVAVLTVLLGTQAARAATRDPRTVESVVPGRMVCSEKCKQILDLANGIKKCPHCGDMCNVAHKMCTKCAKVRGECEVCAAKMVVAKASLKLVLDDREEQIVAGNTAFACDLYQKLRTEKGNLFFSPHSISTALAMTYAGAKGQTGRQMAETLHLPRPEGQLHPAMAALQKSLASDPKASSYELHIANALWGQKGYKFLDGFLGTCEKHYGGGLETVDFVSDAGGARKTINAWVEKQTNEKIKDLIPAGVLNAMTRLVLTNAIYFKGQWETEFDKKATRDEKFRPAMPEKFRGLVRSFSVPMMRQKDNFRLAETDTMQLLDLPYKGGDVAMLIALPRKGYTEDLAALEKSITPVNLAKWTKVLRKQKVQVFLPRWKMTRDFKLSATLKSMGMTDAFDEAKADFSGMTGKKDLYIAKVLHKAFVEVNEEGTEAAAATAVVMQLKSIPRPPAVFRADHPFVFLIRHQKTGAILFMGRVMDPRPDSAGNAGVAPEGDRVFEFANGGAHHHEGFGEWRVRLTSGGSFAVSHDVRGKVTEYGPYSLSDKDNTRLWKLVANADIANLKLPVRRGVPGETQYTFALTADGKTRVAKVWSNDVWKEEPPLMALRGALKDLIGEHTRQKPVL
jgi:serine protease inhibitor